MEPMLLYIGAHQIFFLHNRLFNQNYFCPFTSIYCGKILNAKITAKICEKIYEKINRKHLNLLIPPMSWGPWICQNHTFVFAHCRHLDLLVCLLCICQTQHQHTKKVTPVLKIYGATCVSLYPRGYLYPSMVTGGDGRESVSVI